MSSAMQESVARYGRRALILDGKRPLSRSWQHGQTEAQRAWLLAQHPDANVGVLCGDGLVVLDVDPRHGGDEALARIERARDPFDTFAVLTGGGGRHYYFRDPTRKLTSYLLEPGLEIKAKGSQVAAPPSIHPDTGRQYVDDPASPGWDVFADLPLCLVQHAPPQPGDERATPSGQQSDDWLLTVNPRRYAFDLAGANANRGGFICCPSPLCEPERTPSLKLYDTPAAGWTCFRESCRQPNRKRAGGGIYQFMAHMLGHTGELRGPAFLTIQETIERRYEHLLLGGSR